MPRVYVIHDTGGYFFHFFLLELTLFRNFKKDEGEDCIYVNIPHLKRYNEQYMYDALKYFEPEIKHIENTNGFERINIGHHEPLINDERNRIDDSGYLYMRKVFTKGVEPDRIVKGKYVYIARKNSEKTKAFMVNNTSRIRRQIVNEDQLIQVLEPLGFQIVYFQDKSLEEKLDIFQTSELVVSPGGGALTMLFAANKKTKFVEIIYNSTYVQNFVYMANAIGIEDYNTYTDVVIVDINDPNRMIIDYNMSIDVESFKGFIQGKINELMR